jgi:hypothetical protein
MWRRGFWIIYVLLAAAVSAATLHRLVPPLAALTHAELTRGKLPRPPSQPSVATIECTRSLHVTVSDISRDWSLTQDHPPCTIGGFVVLPVEATAAEMSDLSRRPRVFFQVAASGRVSNAVVSRTSGSKSLDERSLKQLIARNYQRHTCGVCQVSTAVDVDFHGPVWIPESVQ